jgi:hypothetical protein
MELEISRSQTEKGQGAPSGETVLGVTEAVDITGGYKNSSSAGGQKSGPGRLKDEAESQVEFMSYVW